MIPQRRVYLEHDRPQFIEDFIYTPPYELMDRALKVNQEGFDNAMTMANLYGTIPVDFIEESPEARKEAERLMNYYSTEGDKISQAIQADSMNWRKQGLALNRLKNELARDFQTGALSKLRTSKENYDKTMAHLNTLDPTIRDAAKKQLMDSYNSNVASGGLFEDRVFLNRINLHKKFAEEIENRLGGVKDTKTIDLINGMKASVNNQDYKTTAGYIRTLMTENISNRQAVEEAYQAFISEPGNLAYMRQMQDLELENYFKPNSNELLDIDDPINSLSGLYHRKESLIDTKTVFKDNFSADQVWATKQHLAREDARLAEQIRQFNTQLAMQVGEASARGGDRKLSLTNLENQQKANDAINSIFNDKVFSFYIDKAGLQNDVKRINSLPLDKRIEETNNFLNKVMSHFNDGSPAQTRFANLQDNLINIADEITKSTDQSWTWSPNYNDPIALYKDRKALNDAFTKGSQTLFTIPISNNNDGFNIQAQKLKSISHQVQRSKNGYLVGVEETAFTDKNGNKLYREYYPRQGTIGYDLRTGTATLVTAEDYKNGNFKNLRAATFTPSTIEEALPTTKQFKTVNINGVTATVPEEGVGILDVNLIGYQGNDKDGYMMTTTPTTSIYTIFETQGEGSIRGGAIK